MKNYHLIKTFAFSFLLLACMMPVSAFTLSSVNISPRGEQAAGTPMTVSAVIDLPSSGTVTFPSDSELRLSTDLVNPRWATVLVLDGVDTGLLPESRKTFAITGYYLSYPPGQTVQVRLTLTGNLPEDVSPGRDLLNVQELDSGKNILKTARLDLPAIPATAAPAPAKTPLPKITTPKRTFTPIPTDTPTQASPQVAGAGVLAITAAALLAMRRR